MGWTMTGSFPRLPALQPDGVLNEVPEIGAQGPPLGLRGRLTGFLTSARNRIVTGTCCMLLALPEKIVGPTISWMVAYATTLRRECQIPG